MERPDNGFVMSISELVIPELVIRDGHRIGLQQDMPIYRGDPRAETLLACTLNLSPKYV